MTAVCPCPAVWFMTASYHGRRKGAKNAAKKLPIGRGRAATVAGNRQWTANVPRFGAACHCRRRWKLHSWSEAPDLGAFPLWNAAGLGAGLGKCCMQGASGRAGLERAGFGRLSGRRLSRLLASSSVAALLIGGGAPAAFAACAITPAT